ncbi:hypothetical protein G6F61_014252 [Rhizopus arrhizus]|nr:hypothetical protein G6F61_014252 [Rhizopus arrhizus]
MTRPRGRPGRLGATAGLGRQGHAEGLRPRRFRAGLEWPPVRQPGLQGPPAAAAGQRRTGHGRYVGSHGGPAVAEGRPAPAQPRRAGQVRTAGRSRPGRPEAVAGQQPGHRFGQGR